MGGMSKYCAEHDHSKKARTVTGESRYEEKRHRSEFGYPDYDAKPVGVAPPMEIPHPKDIACDLQPTRPQANECQEERDYPKYNLFRDSCFRQGQPSEAFVEYVNKSSSQAPFHARIHSR